MKKILTIAIFLILTSYAKAFAEAPVLYFSDLTDGPTSGWEGSSTKGAAVTIWGRNFGDSRGTSTVTVGGVTLNLDSDFAEWGTTTNPTVPLGMQRITFYLNSSMLTSGAYPNTTIQVTVNGVTSNTLQFHCRTLGTNKIYFFSSTEGSDSYNGLYSTRAGHSGSDGPKLTTAWARGNLAAGDVAYFRAGQWGVEENGAIMNFGSGHNNGIAGKSITIASYPGEKAIFGDAIGHLTSGNDFVFSTYSPETTLNYWTFSKLRMEAWYTTVELGQGTNNGHNNLRFIGNDIQTCYTADLYGGAGSGLEVQGGGQGGSYFYLLGNFIHDIGTDGLYGSDTRAMYRRVYSFYFGGYGQPHHIYVGYNEMGWNKNGRGFQVFGHLPTDTIDDLYIFNNFVHNTSRQCGVIGGGDGGSSYKYIQTCYLYNNIFDVPGPEDYAILFNDSGTWGGTGGTFYVYNNIIRNWSGNAYRVLEINSPDHFYLRNNIIITNSSANVYTAGINQSNCVGNNNLYYGLTGSHKPSWDTSTLDPADPVLITNPPVTTDCLSYFFQSSSLAIGAGVDLSADIPSEQVAGLNRPGVDKDFLGATRTAPFDIGAFEYSSYYNPSLVPAASKSNSESGDVGGGGGGRGGGCFIATASFGTPLAKEVVVLSRFRDEYLLNNNMGRELVRFYYQTSPAIAKYLEKRSWAKVFVRGVLRPVVWFVEKLR